MIKYLKKAWRVVKDFFSSNDPQYPVEPEVTPPKTPTKPEVTLPSSPSKGLKIALCLGHSYTGTDKGAMGYSPKTGTLWTEVDYNTKVINYVVANAKNHNVKGFFGSSSVDAVNKANSAGYNDVCIQLHLNAYLGNKANNYTSPALGCEALVIDGDTKSYPLGKLLVSYITSKFPQVPMRREGTGGLKILSSGDRGVASVKASKAKQKVLFEPFFVDNKQNFIEWEDYAKALVVVIDSL